jgi:hypothetical protein
LLKEAVPKLSRVAVLRNPTNPDTRVFSGEAEVAARSLKVQLHIVEVRAPAEFEGAFAAMTKARASAILVQSVVLVVYGLPYLLVPARAQVLTGQAPVPETYFLRVVGIAFIMLAWLEFQVAGDLVRYRGLTLAYAVLPAFFFVTVALQLATTGFAGALWYWWLNLAVTAVFAVAMFVARRGLAVAGGV